MFQSDNSFHKTEIPSFPGSTLVTLVKAEIVLKAEELPWLLTVDNADCLWLVRQSNGPWRVNHLQHCHPGAPGYAAVGEGDVLRAAVGTVGEL